MINFTREFQLYGSGQFCILPLIVQYRVDFFGWITCTTQFIRKALTINQINCHIQHINTVATIPNIKPEAPKKVHQMQLSHKASG